MKTLTGNGLRVGVFDRSARVGNGMQIGFFKPTNSLLLLSQNWPVLDLVCNGLQLLTDRLVLASNLVDIVVDDAGAYRL